MFRQTISPLRESFFSDGNVRYILQQMITRYRKETGKTIDTQDENELRIIMSSVFDTNALHTGDVSKEVKELNEIVLSITLDQIDAGVKAHLQFSETQGKVMYGENPTQGKTFRSFNTIE